jgi:hypothetical protein
MNQSILDYCDTLRNQVESVEHNLTDDETFDFYYLITQIEKLAKNDKRTKNGK